MDQVGIQLRQSPAKGNGMRDAGLQVGIPSEGGPRRRPSRVGPAGLRDVQMGVVRGQPQSKKAQHVSQ